MIAIVIKLKIINGTTPLIILLIDKSDMPVATKRFSPNGGVNMPIAPLTTIIIPKCTGSIPKLSASGRNNGANIVVDDAGSINIPTIRSIAFIIRSIATFELLILIRASAKA